MDEGNWNFDSGTVRVVKPKASSSDFTSKIAQTPQAPPIPKKENVLNIPPPPPILPKFGWSSLRIIKDSASDTVKLPSRKDPTVHSLEKI